MLPGSAPVALDLATVREGTGGALVAGPHPAPDRLALARVEPDLSHIGAGDLFVALPGERVDGHDLVAMAAIRGAAAALVSRAWADRLAAVPLPLVVVDDPGGAVLDLASWCRARLRARVVGVTGSVGKTTTKEVLAAALAPALRVHATPANRNTALGVALTLLDAPADAEVVVLEVAGGDHADEIADTCRIARPDIGVVTSVHPVHLETMGSIDAIARSKADLVRALPSDGLAVLNGDDPRVRAMQHVTGASTRFVGRSSADADPRVLALRGLGLGGSTSRSPWG